MTLVENRQHRGQLVQQMRDLQAKADAEKRSLSTEEAEKFDKIDTEQEKLGQEIAAEEKRAQSLSAATAAMAKTSDSGLRPVPAATEGRATNPLASEEYRAAINSYMVGDIGFGEVRSRIESRTDTMQVGLFVKGGALVMPQQMAAGLVQAVDDETVMLGLCNIERLTAAESLGVTTLDTDPADADWTVELKTGNQTDLALGKRELRPHPLAKSIRVSNTLLRRTSGGAESLVLKRMAYKFGITFEKALLSGDGVRKPLGVFTASSDGIPTSRDVSTGNLTSSIGADGLIEAKHAVKAAYWQRLTWIFHREAIKQIRKLKDGNGQYLWAPGLTGGVPDRILESPYKASEYAPNTFTTGLYVGIIGDFKQYTVAIALDMTIQRLVELYAATNEVGFIGRMEADGQPILSEAFARVKLA